MSTPSNGMTRLDLRLVSLVGKEFVLFVLCWSPRNQNYPFIHTGWRLMCNFIVAKKSRKGGRVWCLFGEEEGMHFSARRRRGEKFST